CVARERGSGDGLQACDKGVEGEEEAGLVVGVGAELVCEVEYGVAVHQRPQRLGDQERPVRGGDFGGKREDWFGGLVAGGAGVRWFVVPGAEDEREELGIGRSEGDV